jgi:hypothetical protein
MQKLLKLFLDTTDKFLCDRIKDVFDATEKKFNKEHQSINLQRELEHFQENPLGCVIGLESKFETDVKLKIKFIIGLFFVFIPIVVFSLFSYITGISTVYAFLGTLPVAFLVSSRMEELSKRYVQLRAIHSSAL